MLQDGELIQMALKPNDVVLLPEYGGQVVKIGDEELSLFREDDILGILE